MTLRRLLRRPLLLGAASHLALPALRSVQPADAVQAPVPAGQRWDDLRSALFDGRATERLGDDGGLALGVPRRALDPAAVPVSITVSADLASHLRAVWLVVDANPAPLALYAEPGPSGDFRSLSTVVRVEARGMVHVVAETGAGRLFEAAAFVEAVGGVSAPQGIDPSSERSTMGRMRLDLPDGPPAPGRAVPVQLTIDHPNTSGRQADRAGGRPPPASFLRRIAVRYRGADLLRIEADSSVAEDPTFGFSLPGEPGGALQVEAEDSDGRRFRGVWMVGAAG